MARLPRLMGRGRALEVLLGTDDIPGDLAERYGYVNRSLPDSDLDVFVESLATRIASFDKRAISETKRFVDVASLPPDFEIAPEWDVCFASIMRPAAQTRIKTLMELGLSQARRCGRALGLLRRATRALASPGKDKCNVLCRGQKSLPINISIDRCDSEVTDEAIWRRRNRGHKTRCSLLGWSGDDTGRRGRDGGANRGDLAGYCKKGGRAAAAYGTRRSCKEQWPGEGGSYGSGRSSRGTTARFVRETSELRRVMHFSSEPGDVLSDHISTPRGLAIKIIGVEGEMLPNHVGEVTQDLIL